MKYKIGDILFVKKCEYKNDLAYLLRLPPRLYNTFGIIIRIHKYNDILEGEEADNVYVWLSQIDAKTYCFYEEDVEAEVFE